MTPGIYCLHCSEDITLAESYQASKEVNMAMMRYFRQEQLLVFRSAILLAFVGPHLRGEVCFVIIIVS